MVGMKAAHLEFCASPTWRQMVEEQILPDALRHVELGPDVVEVGPGPGFTTDVLRTLTDHLTAVEIDEDLAASLAHRLAGSNVEVVRGDARALDLPDDRFSGATSFHMLHHVPTAEAQDKVLSELARVLMKGGRLVAADGVFSESSQGFHQDDNYNPIDPELLGPRLESAGFTSVAVDRHDLGWFCTAVKVG
jgi:ubiquinone/menaquinone biosynthesis C-methylase UbiE